MIRLGSVLFAIGALSVLGTTFGLGILAGRYWRPPAAPGPAQARPDDAPPSGPRVPDARRVTFYGELQAPAPPSGASPPVAAAAARPAAGAGAAPPPPPVTTADTPEPRGRFGVQVGAFRDRAQAEALRGRLAAAGDDAYLVEPEAAAAPWRVRVGAYDSREAASRAAERLAAERRVPTFVTAR